MRVFEEYRSAAGGGRETGWRGCRRWRFWWLLSGVWESGMRDRIEVEKDVDAAVALMRAQVSVIWFGGKYHRAHLMETQASKQFFKMVRFLFLESWVFRRPRWAVKYKTGMTHTRQWVGSYFSSTKTERIGQFPSLSHVWAQSHLRQEQNTLNTTKLKLARQRKNAR